MTEQCEKCKELIKENTQLIWTNILLDHDKNELTLQVKKQRFWINIFIFFLVLDSALLMLRGFWS